ncbi:uncharacterized protein [Procambarus clarkii]|uniref:uncharacterized protein n=1 Tax=Procambarus clarkii TaxID=6728 RepID=UPI00374427D6
MSAAHLRHLVGVAVLFTTLHYGSAATCSTENIFGQTSYMTCPQLTDAQDKVYCCGTKRSRYCCDTPYGVDDEVLKQFADKAALALAQVQASPMVPTTVEDRGDRSITGRIKVKLNATLNAVKDGVKIRIQGVKEAIKRKIKNKAANVS